MSINNPVDQPSLAITHLDSIEHIEASQWNHLIPSNYPFIRHEFLLALEQSGCVSPQAGWTPCHLILRSSDNTLIAAMPLYRKQHSWGEYVFDQQWAQAYEQYGFHYYPKLLTAIPYTPCSGPRIIGDPDWMPIIESYIIKTITSLAKEQGASSWHCLFPSNTTPFNSLSLLARYDVQFHWFNRGYQHIEDFLKSLSSRKRKNIKRERRRIAETGITCKRFLGTEINEDMWQDFYRFYAATYLKRQQRPYLNLTCFQQWGNCLPEQMMMVMAYHNNRPVAAALSFFDETTLYGRYWGCLDEFHSLHFETCYYQGIEFCIERNLQQFDSGAQGEHKISRGFEPVKTQSFHWIENKRFRAAISDFLERESLHIDHYQEASRRYLPFKIGDD